MQVGGTPDDGKIAVEQSIGTDVAARRILFGEERRRGLFSSRWPAVDRFKEQQQQAELLPFIGQGLAAEACSATGQHTTEDPG